MFGMKNNCLLEPNYFGIIFLNVCFEKNEFMMIFSEEVVSCIFLIVSSLSSVVPLSSLAGPPLHKLVSLLLSSHRRENT